MIFIKEFRCEYPISALKALCHLIVNIFEHHSHHTYDVTASDTAVCVKRTSFFNDKDEIMMSGEADEMQKIVLAARIIGNKAREQKISHRQPGEVEWYELRLAALLQVLNLTRLEWLAAKLKLDNHDVPLMLEFAAKFPEMKFGDAVNAGRRFYATLDERLMDIATSPGGELILTTDDYYEWQNTKKLARLGETRVVRDAVVASIEDIWGMNACRVVERVRDLLIMPRPADSA